MPSVTDYEKLAKDYLIFVFILSLGRFTFFKLAFGMRTLGNDISFC
jgi:hypothetical protein